MSDPAIKIDSPAEEPVSSVEVNDQAKIKLLQKQLVLYSKINDLYHESGLNISVLFNKLLNLVVENLEAKGGSLWLLEEDKQSATCKVATGPGAKEIVNLNVPKSKGIVGWVIQNKKSTIVNDTAKDKRFVQDLNAKTTSILATPLMYRDELIGLIEIVDKTREGEVFVQKDLTYLEDICTPVGLYLKSTMSQKKQSDLLKKLQVFKNVQEILSSTMDLDQLLNIVVNKAIELLEAQVGSIWLVDEDGESITCSFAEGPTKDKVIGVKVKKGTGIIGWVVEKHQPSIVADCTKDPRFSAALDKKINFVTESLISAPLMVRGSCLGAIQIINKKSGSDRFDQEDLDFLTLFSSSAAMYIRNAQLFASEKKAKELGALINISKEITSTLDIDSVLMSVVNLTSDIIPYERAVISTFDGPRNSFVVKAINGQTSIDQDLPEVKDVQELHNRLGEGKKEFVVNSSAECADPKQFPVNLFDYYKRNQLESFWSVVLRDEQGAIGMFSAESKQKNMITPAKSELLSLLVSQVTVALRNAELYSTIPSGKVISSIKHQLFQQLTQFKYWTSSRILKITVGTTAVIAALTLIKLPYKIETNIEVVPIVTTYYAEASSRVSKVLVKEGDQVETGQTLALLDSTDLKITRNEKEGQRQKLNAEMIKMMVEDKMAEFKIKEKEKHSLDLELEKIERQLKSTELKATYPGIVVSEKLNELLGLPVSFGQEIIKVARRDKVFVQFEVPESEVIHVAADQEAKFKVFGYPNVSFSNNIRIKSVAGEGRAISEADKSKVFTAQTEVDNQGPVVLRPGMTGRGKIYGHSEPLWYNLFSKPLAFLFTKILF